MKKAAAVKNVFDSLLMKGMREGRIPARSKEARDWFRKKAQRESINRRSLIKEGERQRSTVELGSMYFFKYDPKTKDKLPFYDKFPLVFPIGPAKGGFLGINFHYLPPAMRAKLMDALYTLVSDDRYDAKTKVIMSYRILNAAAKFKYFKPCIKHYLSSHVQGTFIKVAPSEWDIALFLPLAQFQKASIKEVYEDSLEKIK